MENGKVFIILKDGFQKKADEIQRIYEKGGLILIKQIEKKFEKSVMKKHYAHISTKPFFEDVINYMSDKNLLVMFFSGKNAVEKARKITGSTDPVIAQDGTIRGFFGKNIQENAVHCPENNEEFRKELYNLFTERDLENTGIFKY